MEVVYTDAEEKLNEAKQLHYEIKQHLGIKPIAYFKFDIIHRKWMKEVFHLVTLMLFEDGIRVNTEMRKMKNKDYFEVIVYRTLND